MLVKIVPPDGDTAPTVTLFSVGEEVNYGVAVSHAPPVEENLHRDYDAEIGARISILHTLGVEEPPSGTYLTESGKEVEFWSYRFAWWQTKDGIAAVATSGDIYVLTDTGDTIERTV